LDIRRRTSMNREKPTIKKINYADGVDVYHLFNPRNGNVVAKVYGEAFMSSLAHRMFDVDAFESAGFPFGFEIERDRVPNPFNGDAFYSRREIEAFAQSHGLGITNIEAGQTDAGRFEITIDEIDGDMIWQFHQTCFDDPWDEDAVYRLSDFEGPTPYVQEKVQVEEKRA
jgi:hypothetical protein